MLVPRSDWGARQPRQRTRIGSVRGVQVHYSGALAERKIDHRHCPAVVRGIQNFHMDTRGWSDIAYNFLPCIHGYVFVGRGDGIRSAAGGTDEANEHYPAVCFLGGDKVGRDDVTPEGRIALAFIISRILSTPGYGNLVRPHSHFTQTECPGNELRRFITVYNAHIVRGV